ncbi:MAG TPA: ISKra4 family transposase [Candidatus Sulfotelmatobacter sp.]|nr:ISKra4 family transposase [Candidatus Sulfotelmatobacter sp.]
MEVQEQLLRLGRRGQSWRPFCQNREVVPRGYSRRLQRVLTDFGADDSFSAAAAKVQEHYRIEVPVSAVRRHTLQHGRKIAAVADQPAASPAKQLITEMDGSMIPIMEPGTGSDKRKGKKLFWREVRLCCARAADREQAWYGVTLGSAEVAGWVWLQTAKMAGLTEPTQVHGLGDGARWILDKFTDSFGEQGSYLVDFYHVSEYLAAAALAIARPGKQREWRRRQQGHLLENKVSQVLRNLRAHLEPAAVEEAPVRAAFDYISERRDHLDYAGARKEELPIGSGEVEGGHRHVVQQRLKLSGCWWKEPNASSMLNLRAARANNLWADYWNNN